MLFGVRLSFPELKNNIFILRFSFLGSDLKGFVEVSTVEYSQKMGKKMNFLDFVISTLHARQRSEMGF